MRPAPITVRADSLNLPRQFRRKIKSEYVEIEACAEGIMIREAPISLLLLEGAFKGCGLTLDMVIAEKRLDIELDGQKLNSRKKH